jgi:hypothetical protein
LKGRLALRHRRDGDKANQRTHYMLRWVSTCGDKGPWIETVSATIGA